MRYFKSSLLAIMVALFAVGTSNAAVLGAAPNLGVITNATVKFFASDGITLLGTGNTGAKGVVTVKVGSYHGPVVVVVKGDDDAAYYDESAGTLIPFRAPNKIYAIVPRPGFTIAVTPLTDIAYFQALVNDLFPLTPCEVIALNEIVRSSLVPGLRNILSVPTRFSANTTRGSLSNSEGGRYAAVLAALASLGADSAAPALAIFRFLRIDAADSIIDARIKGGRLVRQPPLYISFIDFRRKLQLALNRVAATFGTAELRAHAAELVPHDGNVNSRKVDDDCAPPPTGGTGGTGSGGGGGF